MIVIYLIFICWRDFVSEHFQNSDQFSRSVVSTSDPMDCSTPGFPIYHQLLELAQTHVHRVGDNIQPSHPLSSPSLPAFSLSQHQALFCWVSSSNQPKYWSFSFSFSISPFSEYSRLISFRIDWLDLLAVQGTLKSLLQHHSSKAYFENYIFKKFNTIFKYNLYLLRFRILVISLH